MNDELDWKEYQAKQYLLNQIVGGTEMDESFRGWWITKVRFKIEIDIDAWLFIPRSCILDVWFNLIGMYEWLFKTWNWVELDNDAWFNLIEL